MAAFYTCIYQTCMQIWFNTKNFCQTLGCCIPSLHLCVRYQVCISLGNVLLKVRPLCIGLINAWFNHAGSKHNHIFLFGLETIKKLLHASSISLTTNGVMVCCFCICSHSSFNGCCSAYFTHLRDAWHVRCLKFQYLAFLAKPSYLWPTKNLHSLCLSLYLIIMLQTPNWGMLVLLYMQNDAFIFMFHYLIHCWSRE